MEPAPELPSGLKGDLARLLRYARVERGFSQESVAQLMSSRGHQWHQTTVVKTERAEREPRYTELLDLGQILEISPEALLDPANGATVWTNELAALEQQERLLTLRADLLDRDLASLANQRKDAGELLREVRRRIAAAHKAEHDAED